MIQNTYLSKTNMFCRSLSEWGWPDSWAWRRWLAERTTSLSRTTSWTIGTINTDACCSQEQEVMRAGGGTCWNFWRPQTWPWRGIGTRTGTCWSTPFWRTPAGPSSTVLVRTSPKMWLPKWGRTRPSSGRLAGIGAEPRRAERRRWGIRDL